MMQAAVSLCLLALISTARGQGICPAGYTQFEDSCYAYMQGKASWSSAEQTCVVLHAHLVEIYTPDELQFVQNFSRDNGNNDVWLGAHDLVKEGLWSWAWSGSNFELTAWETGQPDDGDHGRENCMELDKDTFLWNDEDCDHHKHYICQMSTDGESMIG